MRTSLANFCVVGLLLMSGLFTAGISRAATSATFTFSPAANSRTITWTWTEDRQIGQFCNGDWWVVGPITLKSITRPNGAADKDGTQFGPANLNTWGSQGFDSRVENTGYDASLNIANRLPLSIPVNSSLISAISKADASRIQLEYQAVLTVLPTAPPDGSFRPFYGGTNKAILHNKSDIDYSRFRSLAPVANTPTFAGLEEAFRYPIVTIGNEYPANEYNIAKYNCTIDDDTYGSAIANMTTQAGLLLNLNYTPAQKEALAIRYIQYGLDTYGAISAGGSFPGNGGHSQGRKLPFAIAAHVLNDAAMIAACAQSGGGQTVSANVRFGEDQQTFFVTQNDINLPRKANTGYQIDPYPQSSLGMPEWGPGGSAPYYTAGYPENTAGYNWGRTYRFNVFPYLVGAGLAVELMGLESTWNHPAFVAYTKRFAEIEYAPQPGQAQSIIPQFTLRMLDAYSGSAPPATPSSVLSPVAAPGTGNYTSPQSVSLSSGTSGAAIYYTTNGSTPTTSSTLYTAPFNVTDTTTVKAIATKSGMANSGVMTETYTFTTTAPPPTGGGMVSQSTWPGTTTVISPAQAGNFSLSIQVTPAANNIDSQVALSKGLPSGYSALAAIGRFNSSGRIDANNDNPYTAKNVLAYSGGVVYTFEFTVNMVAKTYTLKVTPAGGSPVLIAENYAFRATAPADQLTHVVFHHDAGSAGSVSSDKIDVIPRPPKPDGLRELD